MTPTGPETWRLFIAVPVPETVRASLAALVAGPRSRHREARWQDPGTWHLTLRFLGETPVSEIPAVAAAVRRAAATGRPFTAGLDGVGSFDRHRGPRVVWIGIGRGSQELDALAHALATELSPGTAATEPPFRAHLTLAREASADVERDLAVAVAGVGDGERLERAPGSGPLSWRADRLILYRSELGRGPARHTAIVDAPLGADLPT